MVAAIACVLAAHLGCARVPMHMLVLSRDAPDLKRSVSSMAQGGLVCVSVPDPGGLEWVVPSAWSGTLAAMRHGRYDGNELSERLSSFDSGGRHLTVSPPSISIMRDIPLPPLGPELQPADDCNGPYVSFAGQVDRPCLGLNFHAQISGSNLSLELRAGTHLISQADCRRLVLAAIKLIVSPATSR